jgi:protein O-GlcNAc transferase
MNMAPSDALTTMRQAYEFVRQGRLQRAAVLCGEVLQQDTEHAEAWLLRAVIAMQAGNAADAVTAARRSLRSDPTRAAVRALLGDALLMLRQPQQALESYQAALLQDSGLVSAHFGRGSALLALQRPREALASYDEVLRRRPDDAEALFHRGNALFELQEWATAVASYDRAVALRPSYADAFNNRGSALLLLRKTNAALASFDAALSIEPTFAEALYHRGETLRLLGAMQDALQSFDGALLARPDYVEACVGRGEVLRELRRPAEAMAGFERVLALSPGYAAAHRGIGDVLLDLSRSEEALAAYDESLRLDARSATVHCNRARALMQIENHVEEALLGYVRALELEPDIPFAAGSLFYAQISRADWSIRVPMASTDEILRSVQSGKPACLSFAFLSISDCAALQLQCAQVFAAQKCGIEQPRRRAAGYRHHRCRVAYVSADLREHATTYLIVGALERHDRGRFETYGISLRPAEASAAGERIAAAFDRFIDVSEMTDDEAVDLMRDLEIDIAVDLNGYTQGCRPHIFAHGAAPIQVSYLGYPGTMGAPFMDYLLADEFVIPPEKRRHYGEAVVYLPDCFQANDDKRAISERVFSRAEVGLPQDAFAFCCFNNTHKVNPRMFDIWMRLLAQLPESALWLLCHESVVRDNLRREAASRSIDPRRLVFAERLPYAEHLARLRLADLFLDTLPFNAGTTASDALWAGVPVLTLSGDAFAARMAGSLLRAAGTPELIACSDEEYESKAIELARSPQTLRQLRGRLAQNRGTMPLFDTARFTAHLEAAYEEMWMRMERGDEPHDFSVRQAPP